MYISTSGQIAVFSLLLLSLVACSDGDDEIESSSSSVNSGLNGTWVSGCVLDVVDGDASIYAYTIRDSELQLQIDSFPNDASCVTRSAQTRLEGELITGMTVPLATGPAAIEVDLRLQSGSITYFDANVILDVNASEICGISDWVAGVSRDVTSCLGVPRTIFDIVRVDGDALFFGDNTITDGETPETRHTALNLDVPYSRQ